LIQVVFAVSKAWTSLRSYSEFQKDGIRMSAMQSNTDALLVAIPMVGLLFAGFFRLDEMVGKPKKRTANRRQMSGWDKNGRPVCADPDGKTAEPAQNPPRKDR
jgi:hypothetical protein